MVLPEINPNGERSAEPVRYSVQKTQADKSSVGREDFKRSSAPVLRRAFTSFRALRGRLAEPLVGALVGFVIVKQNGDPISLMTVLTCRLADGHTRYADGG